MSLPIAPQPRLTSVAHLEAVGIDPGVSVEPFGLDHGNARHIGALPQEGQQLLQVAARTARHDIDAAVRLVAHITPNVEACRGLSDKGAKEHTLNVPSHSRV